MRKLLERINQRLQGFIAQRDDLALVLRCGSAESAVVIKIVEGIQDSATSELVWVFADDFTTADAYAAAVVKNFATKHELVRLMQGKEGMPVWPSLPPALTASDVAASQRLRELMVFGRSLLPAPEGLNVVWAFFPLTIAAADEYAALMAAVLQHEYPFPWCHHMRVIVRDDTAKASVTALLSKAPRIAFDAPDLSHKAIAAALEEESANLELPIAQRLQAMLLTAAMDFGHKQYTQALDKYQMIFRYFAHTGNLALVGLALNGMGEVHRARGDLENAGACFEAALIPSADGENPPLPVMMNVILNLANLRASEKRWPEAEAYFDQAQKLASCMRNPGLKVTMIENMGEAQLEQGKAEEALATWEAAATIAAKLELREAHKSVLERQRQYFVNTRDVPRLRQTDEELAALAQAVEL